MGDPVELFITAGREGERQSEERGELRSQHNNTQSDIQTNTLHTIRTNSSSSSQRGGTRTGAAVQCSAAVESDKLHNPG